MRDKKRIEPFLKELQEYWETNYDLRFGQIVYILAEKMMCTDIFFPEEKEWLEVLKELNKK